MKPFLVILRYELFSLFISPGTYIATFYFLSLLAIGFRFFIESFVYTDWILPPLSSLVVGLLFGSPALIPFITMRSFSEEIRLGTLETLISTPVSNLIIVIGKWCACYLFFILILFAAFALPMILNMVFPEQGYSLGFHEDEIWIGNGLFISIFGASFTSIGVLASSLTKNQMVAGMLTFTLLTLYISCMAYSFGRDASQLENGLFDIIYTSFNSIINGLDKLEKFSVGIIDISTILHQLSLTFFCLVLTTIQINRIHR
jgi:ABC-2 type transport system permease protein